MKLKLLRIWVMIVGNCNWFWVYVSVLEMRVNGHQPCLLTQFMYRGNVLRGSALKASIVDSTKAFLHISFFVLNLGYFIFCVFYFLFFCLNLLYVDLTFNAEWAKQSISQTLLTPWRCCQSPEKQMSKCYCMPHMASFCCWPVRHRIITHEISMNYILAGIF